VAPLEWSERLSGKYAFTIAACDVAECSLLGEFLRALSLYSGVGDLISFPPSEDVAPSEWSERPSGKYACSIAACDAAKCSLLEESFRALGSYSVRADAEVEVLFPTRT